MYLSQDVYSPEIELQPQKMFLTGYNTDSHNFYSWDLIDNMEFDPAYLEESI